MKRLDVLGELHLTFELGSHLWYELCILCSQIQLPKQTFNKGFPGDLEGKASTCNAGDLGSILEMGRSPGEGNGNPHCTLAWKIPWEAAVHGVTKSRKPLSDFTFTFLSFLLGRSYTPSWTKKSTQKICRWQWHMKGCFTSNVIKKFNLKQQWNTTIPLLKWPKSRTLTTPNAGKDVKQWEISFIAGGNAKWYSCFRR